MIRDPFCGRWKAEVFAGFSMAWSCSSGIDNTGDADSANCPALDFLGMSLAAQLVATVEAMPHIIMRSGHHQKARYAYSFVSQDKHAEACWPGSEMVLRSWLVAERRYG